MLPPQNIESQKLVIEMALTWLGTVNNLDQVMERLFPPDMLPVDQLDALASLAKKINPPPPPTVIAPGAKQLPSGQPPVPAQARESDDDEDNTLTLAQYRTRRIIRLAREAEDALAVIG
jgi:hypothetical protein